MAFRGLAVAASVASMFVGPSAAAQQSIFSSEPIWEWAGFYLGGFGGQAWGEVLVSELLSQDFGYYFLPGDSYGFEDNSFFFGARAGRDWQWSRFVAGLGLEVGLLETRGSITDPNSLPTGAPVTKFESGLYGALTGRAGFAFSRFLIYGRGGLAVLDASGSTLDTCGRSFCGQTMIDASGDDLVVGLTIGGGIEVQVAKNLSVGGEYRYFDFEDLDVSGISTPPALYTQAIGVDFHTVQAFVSYRW